MEVGDCQSTSEISTEPLPSSHKNGGYVFGHHEEGGTNPLLPYVACIRERPVIDANGLLEPASEPRADTVRVQLAVYTCSLNFI